MILDTPLSLAFEYLDVIYSNKNGNYNEEKNEIINDFNNIYNALHSEFEIYIRHNQFIWVTACMLIVLRTFDKDQLNLLLFVYFEENLCEVKDAYDIIFSIIQSNAENDEKIKTPKSFFCFDSEEDEFHEKINQININSTKDKTANIDYIKKFSNISDFTLEDDIIKEIDFSHKSLLENDDNKFIKAHNKKTYKLKTSKYIFEDKYVSRKKLKSKKSNSSVHNVDTKTRREIARIKFKKI